MSEFAPDLVDLSEKDWFAALDRLADEHGYLEHLGHEHVAVLTDAGPQLLVTFETYPDIVESTDTEEPRGFHFVKEHGWSHLAIIARGDSMFRTREMYGYFDRLIDDGFFEDFDSVLFYGHHVGGYAACAYSVCAPGSQVLALRPMATLSPRVAPWDERHLASRRLDWTSRFGYAPDMIEATQRATLIYDPRVREDAMHAALFDRSNVVKLRVPSLGTDIETMLDNFGLTRTLIELAMAGVLSEGHFNRLYRKRRQSVSYLRNLDQFLIQKGRTGLSRQLCETMLVELPHRYFRRRLAQLAELDA